MTCPRCDASTRTLETRRADDGAAVRRRRECPGCAYRFTTFERRARPPLWVRKRSGGRQRFDRVKLRAALLRAAHKRPVTPADVEAIVDRVELAAETSRGEVAAERIAELCLESLRELDPGAYLQFAGTLPAVNTDFPHSGEPGSVRAEREDSQLRA